MTAHERMLMKELLAIAKRCLELETDGRFAGEIERTIYKAERAVSL